MTVEPCVICGSTQFARGIVNGKWRHVSPESCITVLKAERDHHRGVVDRARATCASFTEQIEGLRGDPSVLADVLNRTGGDALALLRETSHMLHNLPATPDRALLGRIDAFIERSQSS